MAMYILQDLHITWTQAKILWKSDCKIYFENFCENKFQQQAQSLAQSSQQRAPALHLTGKKLAKKHIVDLHNPKVISP